MSQVWWNLHHNDITCLVNKHSSLREDYFTFCGNVVNLNLLQV